MSDTIHIALAANHRYVNGLLVALVSIMRSASAPNRLQFHVFSDGLSPEDKERVLTFAAEYHVPTPRFLEPDMTGIRSRFKSYNGSHTTFLRLFFPDTLNDLDWVIYTDVDMIWMRDICELWKQRDDTVSILWCQDIRSIAAGVHKYSKWNPDFDESRYCCAGVILINLKRMREQHFVQNCIDFVHRWGTPFFVDQDILNFICRNDAKLLPQYWDTMRPTREAVNGLVYHFNGLGKHFNEPFTGWRPLYYPWYRFFYDYVEKTPNRQVCSIFKRAVFWLLGCFYPNRRLITFLTGNRMSLTDNIERQLFFAWLARHIKA